MATDATIRANLARLKDVTKIVIAQRVASVMDADQIVVLDDGRRARPGHPRGLLASDPIYQEILRVPDWLWDQWGRWRRCRPGVRSRRPRARKTPLATLRPLRTT